MKTIIVTFRESAEEGTPADPGQLRGEVGEVVKASLEQASAGMWYGGQTRHGMTTIFCRADNPVLARAVIQEALRDRFILPQLRIKIIENDPLPG